MQNSRCFILGLLSLLATQTYAGHIVSFPEGIDGDSNPERQDIQECIADLEGWIEWSPEDTLRAAETLQEHRIKHQEQKTALLLKLQSFVDEAEGHTNHDWEGRAIQIAESIAKVELPSCIETHDELYICHNAACTYQPELIRRDCYEWLQNHPSLVKDGRATRLGEP